jgi:predicted AlkP superfamily pyrophosphatase or phosphodiesterase
MSILKRTFLLLFSVSAISLSALADPPKLIVAILVDQLRYDYLERYGDQFTTNGFRQFTEKGAFMSFAHYNYVPTVTGPGHASFLSGATPMMHGIVANDWFDRKTGKDVNCVEDQSVDGVGATPGKGRASPKNFIGGTFADELRLRFRSKIVGISIKDRAAILPAGKKPAGAYWFYPKNGNFITSSYYMDQLPGWVQDFNKRKRAADFVGKTWERLLDPKYYPNPDSADWEENLPGEKKPVFNHVVAKSDDGYDNIVPSPFSNQLLVEFAEAAIEGEHLGQGTAPDLLCVSFSAIDAVGHRFGPYSQEVQDLVLRLDRQLSELFQYLDQKIGLANVAMVLTADHGAAPVPEFVKEQGLDGQRFNEGDFINELKEHLSEEFGPGKWFSSTKLFAGNLFLNHATLEKKKLKVEDVTRVVRDFALASGKFQACFSREQILDGRAPGPFGKLVTNGYNAERGGDLVLLAKPFFLPGTGKTGTTHGSPYSYDTHVPILFYGSLFNPGRYADEFFITDIVPTFCAALGMNEPPGCMGKPLVKVIANH